MLLCCLIHVLVQAPVPIQQPQVCDALTVQLKRNYIELPPAGLCLDAGPSRNPHVGLVHHTVGDNQKSCEIKPPLDDFVAQKATCTLADQSAKEKTYLSTSTEAAKQTQKDAACKFCLKKSMTKLADTLNDL
jgi:hypothetical protein